MALAEAARDRGAAVVLVTAHTGLPDPAMLQVVRVTSAQEMCEAVLKHVGRADALIMAAAVADYRPSAGSPQKIKKSADDMTIALTKTVDILKAAQGDFIRVGFSAAKRKCSHQRQSQGPEQGLGFDRGQRHYRPRQRVWSGYQQSSSYRPGLGS